MNALPAAAAAFALTPASREQIVALEQAMGALPQAHHVTLETLHDFCPGVYARTIFMPAGTVLTSKIHKTQHFFVVTQGSATVIDSHGAKQLIAAPHLGVTMPGTKRALHIHEDCIWTTFHPTTLTDVGEIEKAIMADSFEDPSWRG